MSVTSQGPPALNHKKTKNNIHNTGIFEKIKLSIILTVIVSLLKGISVCNRW